MDTSSVTLKQCSNKDKCINPLGSLLPATVEYFHKRNGSPDGLRGNCIICRRNYENEYRKLHPKPADTSIKYRKTHREQIKLKDHNWYIKNKDRLDKQHHDYQMAHLDAFREMCRLWTQTHQQELKAYRKSYYAMHRQEINLRHRSHYAEHREEAALRRRQYRINNPLRERIKSMRRRAKIRENQGTYTPEDIDLQFRSQKGKCWHCGKKIKGNKYHLDHLIPLARGGSNAAENIVISCPFCNLSKGAKLPQEWNGKLF